MEVRIRFSTTKVRPNKHNQMTLNDTTGPNLPIIPQTKNHPSGYEPEECVIICGLTEERSNYVANQT